MSEQSVTYHICACYVKSIIMPRQQAYALLSESDHCMLVNKQVVKI